MQNQNLIINPNFFEEKIYNNLDKAYDNIQNLLETLKQHLIFYNHDSYIKSQFQLQKIENENTETSNSILNKQRGRPKKKINNFNSHIHSKMSFDNICQKLKVLYHHFLINLVNDYIKNSYKGFQKFRVRKVSSEITQNVTKKYNKYLANINLKEFFSNEISNKYKRFSGNKNEENINKLCFFKPKLKELLMMNYYDVYKNLFIYGKRSELKLKYGISEKTLLFNDCINKIRLKESEEYVNRLESIAKGKLMNLLENGREFNNNTFSSDFSTDNSQYLKKRKIEINCHF